MYGDMNMAVHNVHIILDEDEYQKLMKAKDNMTWHDYLLSIIRNKNGR